MAERTTDGAGRSGETPGPRTSSQTGWVWHVTLLSAALGIMLALAIRTTERIRSMGLSGSRVGVSAWLLSRYQTRNRQLAREVLALRKQVEEIESSAKDGTVSTALLKKQLLEERMLAGFAPVRGPGLRITLKNSSLPIVPGTEGMAAGYLVSDTDVNALIWELWAAGAEAISIAGARDREPHRLIVSTTVQPSPGGIVVDGRSLSPPYRVLAIGNPRELRAALEMPEGIVRSRGLDVLKMIEIEESKRLVLPSHDNSPDDSPPAAGA